jgi:hypothetical protein
MPPSLRILRRPETQYLVHFGLTLQDSDPKGQQFAGAPAMIQAAGSVYEIDLHTILTPIAGTIPALRTLQLSATMFYTSASPVIKEFYIYNPTTSQTLTVLMPPVFGLAPSVINLSVPFFMDASAPLTIFWRVGSNPAVLTETTINISATMLTYDVDSYWQESCNAWALATGAVVPHDTTPDFVPRKAGNQQQYDVLAINE